MIGLSVKKEDLIVPSGDLFLATTELAKVLRDKGEAPNNAIVYSIILHRIHKIINSYSELFNYEKVLIFDGSLKQFCSKYLQILPRHVAIKRIKHLAKKYYIDYFFDNDGKLVMKINYKVLLANKKKPKRIRKPINIKDVNKGYRIQL